MNKQTCSDHSLVALAFSKGILEFGNEDAVPERASGLLYVCKKHWIDEPFPKEFDEYGVVKLTPEIRTAIEEELKKCV